MNPIIEVFYLVGDAPFICGGSGRFTIETLVAIEKELGEDLEYFKNGHGVYRFVGCWIPAQIDNNGRIELPGYWELNLIDHAPAVPND